MGLQKVVGLRTERVSTILPNVPRLSASTNPKPRIYKAESIGGRFEPRDRAINVKPTRKLTMAHKGRSSSGNSSPPQTPNSVLFDSGFQQPQTFNSTLCLLGRFQSINRRQGHSEQCGCEGSGDGFDQNRPSQRGEQSDNTSIGGSVSKSRNGCLEPSHVLKSE